MILNRSLGGLGRLYDGDALLGEVYYNIREGQTAASPVCSVVFVGNDVELPADNRSFRLYLEDGRYLVLNLTRNRADAPYTCTSFDGVLHSELAYSNS